MDGPNTTNRRTVLKTLGASAVGGTVLTGTATAHGGEERVPSWLLTEVWEMADRGKREELTDDDSHVPIYYIEKAAADKTCAQVTLDLRHLENGTTFAKGAWGKVPLDQTLHDIPPPRVEFTTLWHEHFVFDKTASKPYSPADLVNEDHNGDPLIDSGRRILDARNVVVVDVPFVFNCPARPARGDHLNYCD